MDNSSPVRKFTHNFIIIAFCALFGFLYVNIAYNAFNWYHWYDLRAYESLFNDPYYHYTQINRSWTSWIKDEPLWYEIVLYLRFPSWTYTDTLNTISVISAATIAYVIYKKTDLLWPLILLVNPSTIDLLVGQVRSALGIAILLVALITNFWPLRIFLVLAAGTVHTSMYLFGALYLFAELYKIFAKKYDFLNQKKYVMILAIFISILIALVAPVILTAIGDRRSNIATDASGLLLSVTWISFIISYYAFGKFDKFVFPHFFYTTCAFVGFFSIFTENYGSRYISVAIPLLIIMIARQRDWRRSLLLLQYGAAMLIYFVFYLSQAGLNFA